MDYTKFKETEQKYKTLRDRVSRGEISPDDMKRELKKMMVLDASGNYWMIGGKTGRWYIYNGTDWKEDNPYKGDESDSVMVLEEPILAPSRPERPAAQDLAVRTAPTMIERPPAATVAPAPRPEPTIRETRPVLEFQPEQRKEKNPVQQSFDLDKNVEDDAPITLTDSDEESGDHICTNCKAQIPVYSHYCHVCGANQRTLESPLAMMAAKGHIARSELVITAIRMPSLMFFLGGLGLIIGVLAGAAFGIFKTMWPDLPFDIPMILTDTRGGVAGGLVFALIGGLGGFLLAAVAAAMLAAVYNFLAFIFGGLRFRFKQ